MVGAHSVVREVTEFPTEANRVGLESETIRHMSETSISAAAPHRKEPSSITDDVLTICAISIVAGILTNILHEGVGHGLVALLTGARSGVLTTVAWSSAFDSRLVAAGGTLVNLAAALGFWLVLRSAKLASMPMRYFLLITCAFNLFTGTGYFFFSGVTELRGLGGCDFRAATALALASTAGNCWSIFIFRRCGGCRYWIGALRGNPATRAGTLAEVDHRAVLDSYCARERGRTAESTRNTTAVGVRPTRDRWRTERVALAAILRSETNGAEAVAGTTCPELCVDWFGGSSGSCLRCRSGTRSNAAQLVRTKGVAIGWQLPCRIICRVDKTGNHSTWLLGLLLP